MYASGQLGEGIYTAAVYIAGQCRSVEEMRVNVIPRCSSGIFTGDMVAVSPCELMIVHVEKWGFDDSSEGGFGGYKEYDGCIFDDRVGERRGSIKWST